MIAFLTGTILKKDTDRVIFDVGGVGYEAFVSLTTLGGLPDTGQTASLHTYLYVREDTMQLFGFSGIEEKDLFLKLIGVSGFGPKLALSILSVFPPASLVKVLTASDVKALTTIPGVGQKGAKRLVLELQEKLVASAEVGLPTGAAPEAKEVFAEARDALVGLGYSTAEATRALDGYPDEEAPAVENVIKYALKNLSSV
jgi:Holliday junction DNA helicase RuvA